MNAPFARTTTPPERLYLRQRSSTSRSTGTYHPTGRDFIRSFYAVLGRWLNETAILSDPAAIKAHPSYAGLVANVDLAMPLILSELARRPSMLVWVLNDTQPLRPFSKSDEGNIGAMARAWVEWGQSNGRFR